MFYFNSWDSILFWDFLSLFQSRVGFPGQSSLVWHPMPIGPSAVFPCSFTPRASQSIATPWRRARSGLCCFLCQCIIRVFLSWPNRRHAKACSSEQATLQPNQGCCTNKESILLDLSLPVLLNLQVVPKLGLSAQMCVRGEVISLCNYYCMCHSSLPTNTRQRARLKPRILWKPKHASKESQNP